MSCREWREVSLKDIIQYISRGITPVYTDEDGVIVLNQKCIRDNRVSYDQSRFTNPGERKIPEDKYLRKYDILINSTGVGTLGRVAQIKELINKTTVDSHVTIVRAKGNVAPKFLGYNLFLQQPNIEALAEGSTGQTELSRTRLAEAIKLLIPPVKEQQAIADTLSCLDDKIELNNRINKNLEEMAQAIFKSWFVDFEPFQDGEFEDSELGRIPKGWRVGTIENISKEVICGKTPSTKDKDNFGDLMPFITIPDMHGNIYIVKSERYLSVKGIKTQSNKTIPVNSVVVSCIATPGLVVLASEPSQTNQQINSIICKDNISHYYVFLSMKNYSNKIKDLGSGGSTTLNLNKTQFSKIKLIIPCEEVIFKFHNIVGPIFKEILEYQKQTVKLEVIRDTLLPKLMSGEIRVPIKEADNS